MKIKMSLEKERIDGIYICTIFFRVDVECPSDSPGTPCPSSRRVLWRWRGKLECFLERQLDWLKGNASLVFLKSASHWLGPEK